MKKDYIFNTIAGLINASEAVIMSMIITRTTGLKDAGYVAIAFAVGNLLLTIGKYGIYAFQVTDTNNDISFSTYLRVRLITISIMVIGLLSYLIYGHYILNYDANKVHIVLFVGLIYFVEAIEDLFKANCQYIGKLYIGALMFIYRWSSILLSFCISLRVTKNTSRSLGISLVVSIIVFIVYCYRFRQYIGLIPSDTSSVSKPESISNKNDIYHLLRTCFPLFLSSFLSFYIVNSSKYAIERYMDSETQACFGFIAMPVFVIGLLNNFIYQPKLVELSKDFNEQKKDIFRSHIRNQYLIIAILTTSCITGAYFLGIPFLSYLYHTDLSAYLPELIILLLGGGFLALSGYQGVLLTIMRKQEYQLYGYIPVSLLAFAFVGMVVKKYGTIGAALTYLILIIFLCVLYEIFIHFKTNEKNNYFTS